MSSLNLQFIAAKLLDLVTASLNKNKIEYNKYTIEISIPSQFTDILTHISQAQDIPLETLLSSAASNSIHTHIQSFMKADPFAPSELAESPIVDLNSKFNSVGQALSSLGELTNKLASLENILTKFSVEELKKNEK